ncbi:MAG: hypothetical protein ACFFBD_13285 [Candidatus Hodarchaeota archaeon]
MYIRYCRYICIEVVCNEGVTYLPQVIFSGVFKGSLRTAVRISGGAIRPFYTRVGRHSPDSFHTPALCGTDSPISVLALGACPTFIVRVN